MVFYPFLNARNVQPADIRRQICEVYGENAMSDGMVRKWVRKLNKFVITCMTSREADGRLQSRAATFYEDRIQKLVPRHDKCLDNSGNHVEK